MNLAMQLLENELFGHVRERSSAPSTIGPAALKPATAASCCSTRSLNHPLEVVGRGRIELPTRRFSVFCIISDDHSSSARLVSICAFLKGFRNLPRLSLCPMLTVLSDLTSKVTCKVGIGGFEI
jgi:hypothetical protein